MRSTPTVLQATISVNRFRILASQQKFIYDFADTDDDDKSDYSSICGVPKVERNKSVIPDNHPHSFLHPGFYSYLKRCIKFRIYINLRNVHINMTGASYFDLLCSWLKMSQKSVKEKEEDIVEVEAEVGA